MVIPNQLNRVLYPYFDLPPASGNDLQYEKVTGGCINDCYKVTGKNKRILFVKTKITNEHAGLLQAEHEGLHYLQNQQVIKTPAIIGFHSVESTHVLILEWIRQSKPTKKAWQQLGEQLAALHQVSSEQFGFNENNYIGSLHQTNTWTKTWSDFFLKNRLKPQLKLAMNKALLPASTSDDILKLCKKFEVLFEGEKPGLLHGDLWNGNILFDEKTNPVLVDPSVYYGSRHMDLAMTTLFGGFDSAFYESYHYHFPLPANHQQLWEICNLYPLLVHVNLFGSSYLPAVNSIIKKYS